MEADGVTVFKVPSTALPFKLKEVAPDTDQDRVDDCPALIVLGEAVKLLMTGTGVGVGVGVAVGVGVGVTSPTITVTLCEEVPAEFLAIKV